MKRVKRGSALKTRLVILAVLSIVASSIGLTPANAETESNANGKELYQLCAQCHGKDGLGMALALAPAIAGQKDWYLLTQLGKFRSGQRGTHFYDIAGMRMRPMALSLRTDQDIADVVAYVAAMPADKPAPTLEGGDPEKGKTYFMVCLACHGPDGGGLQPLNAPALNHSSDWYLLTQLQNFRAGIRGANPADVTGATMRPMSMTLPDEQALHDVIAYIMTLSEPNSESK
jgi:cytochrome c553